MTADSSLITQSSSPPAESWRSQILREFTPQVARLTLVADPDGLLLEEGVLEGIRERGFELIPFEDTIAFRYAFEAKFRSRWDQENVRGAKCEKTVMQSHYAQRTATGARSGCCPALEARKFGQAPL